MASRGGTSDAEHDAGFPLTIADDLSPRPPRLRATARSSPSRATAIARRPSATVGRPRRAARRRAAPPRRASRATASARSAGTTRSTSRPTSRSRAWAPCCTRSTSASSPSSSPTSSTTPRTRSSSSTTRWSRSSPACSPDLRTVEAFIVVGNGDGSALAATGSRCSATRSCSPPSRSAIPWPEIDERAAAAMCYTSGTTGNPKGVVYRHRSTFLHSLGAASGAVFGLNERDRILPIVPMFHANAWGTALRRLDGGRRPRDAAALPPGRAARAA